MKQLLAILAVFSLLSPGVSQAGSGEINILWNSAHADLWVGEGTILPVSSASLLSTTNYRSLDGTTYSGDYEQGPVSRHYRGLSTEANYQSFRATADTYGDISLAVNLRPVPILALAPQSDGFFRISLAATFRNVDFMDVSTSSGSANLYLQCFDASLTVSCDAPQGVEFSSGSTAGSRPPYIEEFTFYVSNYSETVQYYAISGDIQIRAGAQPYYSGIPVPELPTSTMFLLGTLVVGTALRRQQQRGTWLSR